jgi:hypothetical protein
MADNAKPVDPKSTPTPLEHRIDDQRPSGRDTTAEPKDEIDLALDRVFKRAEEIERQHRSTKAALDALAKELKALGVTPGEPVSMDRLPLNREIIEKAVAVLKPGKLKVKQFQPGMGFFDPGELARVRKGLMAAGVTEETAEGSVVFVSLSDVFALDATPAS